MREFIRKKLRKLFYWTMKTTYTFATCGDNVKLGRFFYVNAPHKLYLGNHIYIGPHATLNSIGGIKIQNGTCIGPYLHIYSADHRYFDGQALPYDQDELLKPVEIGENVWIGGDVIILPGVTIGEGAVVGAGSLVTKDVPPGHIVAGHPARTIKQRDQQHYTSLKSHQRIFRKMIHEKTMPDDIAPGIFQRKEIGSLPSHWQHDARPEDRLRKYSA